MSTVLIARFKNKKDAEKVASILENIATVHLGESIEVADLYLGELITEGMQEEGEVEFDEIMAELEEQIATKD